ncbi:MAG: Glutamine-dependent NAD(+) synthetase [Bacteroidia bacterium]|nr:Glutamine-dependent NAD(+) synthetase [Bacteroidia bacterium]
MKIALAQLNYHIGNFESNTEKIVSAIDKAKAEGADLVVFAELSVCGYPPRDFLEFKSFIEECDKSILEIVAACNGIAAIVGAPSVNPNIHGKNLFNSAYFLNEGKIEKIVSKALLPNYDVFDEYRYFEPARTFEVIEFKGERIALTICEDIWDIEQDPMYVVNPMDELAKQKPKLMVNIAASPFDYNHAEERKKVMEFNSKKYELPLFYVNQIGAQTELIFDGGSMVTDSKGRIVEELNYFKEDFKIFDTQSLLAEKKMRKTDSKIERIHDALVLGIRDYFGKMGFSKAILGLSGGIDSAVVLALASRALGKENVSVLLLPSQFSSDHSVSDSEEMCKRLGTKYHIIGIKEIFSVIDNKLKPIFAGMPFNVTEENIQARIRGILLMAMTNKFGSILLNTTNKSEAAVGYGTLYGDMNGGLSILGDVYKTQVYELAHHINKFDNCIPENIITKAPSAELRENQKDSDSLPDYSVLDEILFDYIEKRLGPKELIAKGYDEKLVMRILKLVNTSEYKRHQLPPVLRVSPKAFGVGRRMPIVGKYLS